MLLVDKPGGPTSHDVVRAVRRALGMKRVGHAGTLDPAATGLLVVLAGRATRLARFIALLPKRYIGTVRFGCETATDDAEGEPTLRDEAWVPLDLPGAKPRAEVEAALARVAAQTAQVPPPVSAKKVDGERAYRRVRRGEDVNLEAVAVTIHRLALREPQEPGGDLAIDVECSSGTYVRAIARDLGRALGTRAHLAALRRTGIGPWDVRDAVPLDDSLAARAVSALRPMAEAVAHLPPLRVGEETAMLFRHGRKLEAPEQRDGFVAVYVGEELLGVAELQGGSWAPVVGLAP